MENNNNNIILDLEPISRRFYFPKEKTLYHILIDSGIQIRTLCGGVGKCGKCKLQIKKGTEILNSYSQPEMEILNKTELTEDWRLACQTKINKAKIKQIKFSKPPHIIVFLPDELLIEDFKILTSGINKEIRIYPNVKKFFINVENASLDHPIPDLERILSAINSISKNQRKRDYEVELEVLKNISDILREQSNELTITILNATKIIHCEPKNKVEENYGIAFDIGTTTIVGYLINLNDGKTYAIASMLNPQTAYGEDLITRITYVKDNKSGLQKLNSIVVDALNKLILKLCSEAKITPSQIFEISVVGNSVMHHLFLGLNPLSIGLSPYIPVVQQPLNVAPKDVDLNIHPYGNVYILPLIAGFVGADTIGVILSSKIDQELDLTLAIDIGTNGEIIIGNKDVLVTGSCAAGSALEGAHINDGMRAAGGAIDTIDIDPQTLDVSFTTIKNRKPIGICGSGLIDAVAELLKSKVLTRSGNFNKEFIDSERFLQKDNKTEFIIAKKTETAIGREITLSQKDIREIQMAKAAFFSGTRIILDYLRKEYKKNHTIKQIFLAGAFGNYINKESAKFIGMIPDIPSERIFQIGNAAGIGAINCLLNKELRMKAYDLLEEIDYVEIALEKNFQREYAEAMYFPHLNLDFFPNLDVYKDIPKR
ncbi:MAG: ASKHA domain-containing protein [Candidatus Hodarchaeota archaeon]